MWRHLAAAFVGCATYLFVVVASKAAPVSSRIMDVRGVQLEYIDWGGDGRTILLVPPGCDTAHMYGDVGPLLARDYRTLSFTQRGCGKSDHPETGYQIDDLAEEIAGFLDGVGVAKVTLGGASSGGGKITRFAELYPDRVEGLIYFDTIYSYITPEIEQLISTAVEMKIGGRATQSFEYMRLSERLWELGTWSTARETNLREVYQAREDGTLGGVSSSAWLDAFRTDVSAGHYTSTEINHPALMFFSMNLDRNRAAQFDEAAQAELRVVVEEMEGPRREQIEAFRSNGEHVQIVEMADTGHYPYVHRPRLVVARIKDFLRR
jgi:pimeloyl-ACP methyl ester carboxylesterase